MFRGPRAPFACCRGNLGFVLHSTDRIVTRMETATQFPVSRSAKALSPLSCQPLSTLLSSHVYTILSHSKPPRRARIAAQPAMFIGIPGCYMLSHMRTPCQLHLVPQTSVVARRFWAGVTFCRLFTRAHQYVHNRQDKNPTELSYFLAVTLAVVTTARSCSGLYS